MTQIRKKSHGEVIFNNICKLYKRISNDSNFQIEIKDKHEYDIFSYRIKNNNIEMFLEPMYYSSDFYIVFENNDDDYVYCKTNLNDESLKIYNKNNVLLYSYLNSKHNKCLKIEFFSELYSYLNVNKNKRLKIECFSEKIIKIIKEQFLKYDTQSK